MSSLILQAQQDKAAARKIKDKNAKKPYKNTSSPCIFKPSIFYFFSGNTKGRKNRLKKIQFQRI